MKNDGLNEAGRVIVAHRRRGSEGGTILSKSRGRSRERRMRTWPPTAACLVPNSHCQVPEQPGAAQGAAPALSRKPHREALAGAADPEAT